MKLAEEIKKAKRVYLIGNGGSASNAIHMANDLVSCGVKAQALTADIATFTAIANDVSYGAVFSHQLKVFAEPGDLVIALSGSGRSKNIIQGLEEAKRVGARTFAIFGDYNQHDSSIADNVLTAGKDMQRAEEYQVILGHEAMRCLKNS